MSTLNYLFIKLVNGENIICTSVEESANVLSKKSILVSDPVIVNHIRIPRGTALIESYMLMPWVSFSSDEVVEISTDTIICSTNINENAKKNYIEFIDSRSSNDLEDIIQEEVDGEEISNKKLIDALSSIIGNDENEDEEKNFKVPGNRTIH